MFGVVIERITLPIQAVKINILGGVARLFLRRRLRYSDIMAGNINPVDPRNKSTNLKVMRTLTIEKILLTRDTDPMISVTIVTMSLNFSTYQTWENL